MDPITIGIIGSLAASGIGAAMASGDKNRAMDLANQAAAQIEGLGLPPDLSKQIIYQQLQQGGHLTPELEGMLSEENFTPGQITPSAQDTTQLQATLAALKAQSQGGLTAQQMANQQQLLNQVNASTQAQNKGALNNLAQQGKSGGGEALATMLQNIQGGAQQNSQNALNVGAQGQQAQMSALTQLLSGQQQLRGQNLNTDAQNAQMRQAANMFKAQNASARQARNVAGENASNQYNLNRANYTNDYNTQMANQEKLREQEAQRQYWLDQLAQRQGVANALNGQAQTYMNSANNTQQAWGNVGQGLSGSIAAYGQYQNNKPRAKTTTTSSFTPDPNAGNEYGQNYNFGSDDNDLYYG